MHVLHYAAVTSERPIPQTLVDAGTDETAPAMFEKINPKPQVDLLVTDETVTACLLEPLLSPVGNDEILTITVRSAAPNLPIRLRRRIVRRRSHAAVSSALLVGRPHMVRKITTVRA